MPAPRCSSPPHLSDLDRVAERLVILHEGRILLDQPVDELKESICRVENNGRTIRRGGELAAREDCFNVEEE